MDIIEALQWRYAVKKFDNKSKLSDNQLNTILESLRLTATSYGLQLMRFVVVKNDEIRNQLLPAAYNQRQVVDASHLIVLCRNTAITIEEIENYVSNISITRSVALDDPNLKAFKKGMEQILNWDQQKVDQWMINQIYIALGTMLTACAVEKIDACPMEGFIPEKVDEVLNLKEQGLTSVLLCPIGFRSEEDVFANFKKVRKTNQDVITQY